MAQYIFTDLPQYVKVQSRTEFSSSVVSSGAVLLFSEDGYTLTGKLPDGTFITIGGGSGTAPVGNATSGDLLAGKSATVSGGSVISGTIPTVSASLAGSQVVVPAGYIAASQSFNVSGGVDVSSTTAEAADVLSGKVFYTSGGVMTSGTIPVDLPPAEEAGGNRITISKGYYSYTSTYTVGSPPPVGDAAAADLLLGKTATIYGGTVISGTIPTVSASLAANVTTVPAGYIAESQTLTVPEASSASVSDNIVTIHAGYVASDYVVSAGVDVSDTTATAADVLSSHLFYDSAGNQVIGTMPIGSYISAPPNGWYISSGYYASGFTLQGGTVVIDTTAVAGGVLEGLVFYDSDGLKTTGTIPTVSGGTMTPTTSDQIISSGVYLGGSQVILGDANLVASNIASGVTIFGVTGSHQGPTDFYKCASITSGGSVWTGYKAVLSGGSYSFESAVTSGLSYGDGFTPQVDKIYADGALVKAELFMGNSIPQNGLVFYAPLSQSAATAETGQALTGSPASFTTYLDVPCAQFNGSQYMESEMTNIPYSETPFSISMWINLASNTSGDRGLLGIGTAEAGGLIAIISKSSGITLSGHGNGYGWDNAGPAAFTFNGEWHHLVIVFAQGNGGSRTASMYMDGSLLKSASFIYDPEVYSWGGNHFYIDSYWGGSWVQNCPCLMAALRLYNRELTSDEITALGTEFTPSA